MNVIGWLQKENINKNNKRWTIWKRASFFILRYFAIPQRTLYSILLRYKFFTRRYTDFKKFIENFTVWNWKKLEKLWKSEKKDAEKFIVNNLVLYICVIFLYYTSNPQLSPWTSLLRLHVLSLLNLQIIWTWSTHFCLQYPLTPQCDLRQYTISFP